MLCSASQVPDSGPLRIDICFTVLDPKRKDVQSQRIIHNSQDLETKDDPQQIMDLSNGTLHSC